jgi:DNA-binding NtrC family response regulator
MISYVLYVVDDEQTIRESLSMALEVDYPVKTFAEGKSAVKSIQSDPPDLVLLDIGLPDMNGIEVLKQIKDFDPNIVVIMITAYEDTGTVISAMKCGAYDYVVKPIDLDSLKVTIQNAINTLRLKKEVQVLQERYLEEHLPCFIGESNIIQDVVQFIGMVAKSPDTPILILGETGTGKELIASAIHYRSPNFKGPLIVVNCAAIPRDLIESELFGYEKGAFSGASESGKKGLIEEAAQGTLFLDEVGDLSTAAQAKLLRFLEEGSFYRVGGTKKVTIQTRVVSATNRNLETMIEEELFRKDLYFRLGVIKVTIPSLNERVEDIIPLAKHFLYGFSKKFSKSFTGISPKAESALKEHRWVGNIRELKNIIERAVLTSTGPVLDTQDLGLEKVGGIQKAQHSASGPDFPPVTGEGVDFIFIQKSLERYYIEEALRIAGGNESKAAELLNMNRHTFRYHRKELNIR